MGLQGRLQGFHGWPGRSPKGVELQVLKLPGVKLPGAAVKDHFPSHLASR